MFLSSTFQSALLDKLLWISSLSDMDEIVQTSISGHPEDSKRKAEEIRNTTDEEETEGEDGSDFSFPDTRAPPRASARSRPRAKSVDSGAQDAPPAGKRPRRVPAHNNEDKEPEPDFPVSIPHPAACRECNVKIPICVYCGRLYI
ncbi:hypothetical protein B0H14DRAFT_3486177 [Mycena olivaceomarginata]|nr:hypothetical protein B0H14DRAFT_3486177 [Mycena olivaceomarginata]